MDPIPIPAILFSVLGAAVAHGILGFGFGMIAMAIVPMLVDIRLAVPLVGILGMVVNGTVLYHERAHVTRERCLPLIGGGLLGIPIGVAFLKSAPTHLLFGALGLAILAYVGWSTWGSDRPGQPRTAWGWIAGFIGGAFGGALNTGGPPAIIYASRTRWSPAEIRSTLQAYFFVSTVVQTTLFVATGIITWAIFRLDLLLLPAVIGGAWGGARASRWIDADTFRKLVLAGLLVMGIGFIARAI